MLPDKVFASSRNWPRTPDISWEPPDLAVAAE